MQTSLLKAKFDNFFTSMIQHTDLLVKVIKTTKLVLPENAEKEILPKLLQTEKNKFTKPLC